MSAALPAFSDFVVAAVIEEAFRLLSQGGVWTQQAQARTAAGEPTKPEDDNARCFCAFGALRRAALMALRPADEFEKGRALFLAELAARHLSMTLTNRFGLTRNTRDARLHLIAWNDVEGRQEKDVLLMYRRTLGV